MTYRRAKSLDVLVDEFNTLFPGRSTLSDGWIGDAAHASRDSDHNPWVKDGAVGVVTAEDITEDNEGGHSEIIDWAFAIIIERRDPRVKYLIHEGPICRSYDKPGIPAWTWSKYTGLNAHTKHGHVSVLPEKRFYDSTAPWGLLTASKPKPKPPVNTRVDQARAHLEAARELLDVAYDARKNATVKASIKTADSHARAALLAIKAVD